MKQIMSGGGGGGLRIPTKSEVEVVEILLNLPKILAKSELIKRRSFTWGVKKKRSVLASKSSPSPSPLTNRRIVDGAPDKVAAAEADKSPTTPLCFLPPSAVKKSIKRKAADDLEESYNRMQQEKEILLRETKAMKTLHQGLTSRNMELKAIMQKVKCSRNIEDFHIWNNPMKIIDQQKYNPQITMFAPPTPQQHNQHCQQLVVDPNNWCSGNSRGRFGMFNQIDPRVKIQHGETYDFMGPLDQSKYLMVDNDLRVRTAAAAARQRRILRMKEKENKKVSRGCR